MYYHSVISLIFVICFCDFDICNGNGFQQLLTPSQPARSQFTINDVKIPPSNNLQGKLADQTTAASGGGGFLPGLGTYFQPYPVNAPRDVRSPAIQQQIQHQSTPGVSAVDTSTKAFNLDGLNNAEPILASDRIDPGMIKSPNSLHAAVNGQGKCSFVQMKGTPLPNMNCQKGGMACDKQCGIVDDAESGAGEKCVTVMETMCSEVPKHDCRNVTGKVCTNIADEICDPVQKLEPLTRCDIVESDECHTINEQKCETVPKITCDSKQKAACTTIQEPVCTIQSDQECRQEPERECKLYSDVQCRDAQDTKFHEKCTEVEEEVCKTVYDEVWEKKCEMVNITLPQTDCREFTETQMETKCEVIGKNVNTRVCVNVTDQTVDEVCENKPASANCFEKDCSPTTKTMLERVCKPRSEQVCKSVIEETTEERCKTVMRTDFEEECETEEGEEKCRTEFDYVCEEAKPTTYAPPSDGYGVPSAPPVSSSTYRSAQDRTTVGTGVTNELPQYSKTTAEDRSKRNGAKQNPFIVQPNKNKPPGGRKGKQFGQRLKRKSQPTILTIQEKNPDNFVEKQIEEIFKKQIEERIANQTKIRSKRQVQSSSLWPRHPALDNYQTPGRSYGQNLEHHRLGGAYGQPNRYAQPPYAAPPSSYQYISKPKEPVIECDYVPRENCTKIEGSRNCKQIPKQVPEQICIEGIPVQKVREECTDVTREDCDVESREVPDEDCRLERVELPSERICTYTPRPETREVCQDVTMRAFAEECRQVPRLIERVECDRDMKPIPLKEICVKVDLQLPREECKWETKKDCKYVPTVVTTQKCEPFVRENCSMVMKTVCNEVCREECEVKDKKVCMTIPHQECRETSQQVCKDIPRSECKKVPKEKCSTFERDPKPAVCRTSNRLECKNVPQEECRQVIDTKCQQVPRQKCQTPKKSKCQQICEPVYWCKVCQL